VCLQGKKSDKDQIRFAFCFDVKRKAGPHHSTSHQKVDRCLM
jgi:hypothetical protein